MQRSLQIVVPFRPAQAKSRLSQVLTPPERQRLAYSMLRDVLDAVSGLGRITILTRPGLDPARVGKDVDILELDLELNDALNFFLAGHAGMGWHSDILIVMADLALLTEREVAGVLSCRDDVVLCPGRGGGTNMIFLRNPGFRTCYQGLSFPKHLRQAGELGLQVAVFDSYRAGCDIDQPEDLAEVLLHGQGETKALLESMGFALAQKGRECLHRGCSQGAQDQES